MPLWLSAHNFVTSQKTKKEEKTANKPKKKNATTIGAISHVKHYFKSNN